MALDKIGATIGGALKSLIVALDSNGNVASAHTTVDQNGLAIAVAQDGIDAMGVAAPTGGAGIRGWLSGIYGVGTSILTALAGNLRVNVQNSSLVVTGAFFQATQPISAIALPLPAGAATAANQPVINLDGGGQAHVMNFPATQAVSAIALPLPAGAATAANQPVINLDGGGQAHVMNFPATQAVSAIALPLPAGAATAANQPVINLDGGAQAHVMNFPATQAVSVTALPLPAGAADAATLAAINAKLAALLAAEQPYQGVVTMVVGTAQAAQRAVRINCTTAGNVSITYADGSVDVIPVNVGLSYVAGAVTTINSAGTTASATYATMK